MTPLYRVSLKGSLSGVLYFACEYRIKSNEARYMAMPPRKMLLSCAVQVQLTGSMIHITFPGSLVT